MLESLSGLGRIEVEGILSSVALSLLPKPTPEPQHGVDEHLYRRILDESRKQLSIEPDDETAAARSRVVDFLGNQISESVLHGADLMEIEARLGGTSIDLAGWSTNLAGILTGVGVPKEHAEYYAEGVRRGGTLVIVSAPDNQAEEAVKILNRHGAVDIEERGPFYHDDEQGFQIIEIIEEDLTVGKRQVQRGGTRVQAYVTGRPVEKDVTLHEEHVTVERRPVDRAVTSTDAAFRKGSIEVTETAEVPVAAKTARVVEEVVVGKTATDRVETISDTVRRADVGAEEIPNVTLMTGTAKL